METKKPHVNLILHAHVYIIVLLHITISIAHVLLKVRSKSTL